MEFYREAINPEPLAQAALGIDLIADNFGRTHYKNGKY